MTPLNCVSYFTCLFMAKVACAPALNSSWYESVNEGATVTLQCVCEDKSAVMFYWYKQTLGKIPKPVSTFYKHNDNITFHSLFKDNPRFSLDTKNQKYDLEIADLKIADSATYICVGSNVYDFEFCASIRVSVKDSSFKILAINHSGSETVQPTAPITLQCAVETRTCDEEHSVFWFKYSEESHPGLIYIPGGRNDQCERRPNKEANICVYHLPMMSLTRYHARNYYCAVASCGRVLFGQETKRDFEGDFNTPVVVYFLCTALAFNTILILIFAVSVCKMKTRNCQFKAEASTPSTTLCQNEDDYNYAALSIKRVSRSRREREDTTTDCVYSSVRQ